MVGPQLSLPGHQIPWPLAALLRSYLSSFVHPFNLCIVANLETQSNYRIIGTIIILIKMALGYYFIPQLYIIV